MRKQSFEPNRQPLLDPFRARPGRDAVFAAPRENAAAVRVKVDKLNHVHHGWQDRDYFEVDTRLEGLPPPLSLINTARERKSPNPVSNCVRRWLNTPVTGGQARERAALRLLRDAVLATIRYYALDPHDFDLPTDANILTWSPGKVRNLTRATRNDLFAKILKREFPETANLPSGTRPRVALHVGVTLEADPNQSFEECYVAFTKPAPFWRREGEPLFCVPIVASVGHPAVLFAPPSPPATFATRGHVRFERVGAGRFVVRA